MKRPLFLLLTIAIVLLTYILWQAPVPASEIKTIPLPQKIITINGHKLTVEVATRAEDMAQGLGDRDSLSKKRGMLFVYQDSGFYGFWMRHMRFPLDIIWFKDGKAVDIAYNMPAPKNIVEIPFAHEPIAKADTVLEINSGQAKALGIKIGSELKISQ